MSTFLELCQDLRRESGISGTGPASVINQTGEMQRVVEWILSAYRYIQNLHPSWLFLQTEFSFETISGTGNYTPAAVSLPELGSWKTDTLTDYLTSTGINAEQFMEYVPWPDFVDAYMTGSPSTTPGIPMVFTVKPDQSLQLWPIPNDVYTVRGEYFKRAQTMTANADEPIIPVQFQDVIVWRALMLYGAFAAADEKYSHGQNEYRQILSRLEMNQLPEMQLADSLL